MPSLMRFLSVAGVIAAMGFASIYALATYVTPRTREMTVTIPAQRLKPAAVEAVSKNPKTAGAEPAAETPAAR